jgi:hypothetical protein
MPHWQADQPHWWRPIRHMPSLSLLLLLLQLQSAYLQTYPNTHTAEFAQSES